MGTAGAWTAYRPPAAQGVRACIGEMILRSGDTRKRRRQRASSAAPTFGEVVRRRRLARGLSLRRLAHLLGVSPTYLSLVERGKAAPPTAARVARMAQLLDESADALIALAGRMPEDLPAIIRARPREMAALLREASGLTSEQLEMLVQHARRLNAGNRRSRS